MPDIPVTITGENGAPAPVTESHSSINFGALKAQAAKYLDENFSDKPAEPVVEPVAKAAEPSPTEVRVKGSSDVEPKSTEEPAAPAPEATEETPNEPARVAKPLADDDFVEVTVNGKTELRPWKEAKGFISGGIHFTKNMQQVAKDREAVEAAKADIDQLRQREANFKAFLNDEQSVRQFVQLQFPQLFTQPTAAEVAAAPQNPNVDPNEIATLGQVDAVVSAKLRQIEALVAQTKQGLQDNITQSQAAARHMEQQAKHALAIDGTLKEIFATNPILTAVPHSEDLLRYQVSQMVGPQTTEAEALDMFRNVAKEMAGNLSKHTVAQKKLAVAAEAKAKLETKTIEPKGGAAPQLAPTSYKDKDGRVDLNKVKSMAAAYLKDNF